MQNYLSNFQLQTFSVSGINDDNKSESREEMT